MLTESQASGISRVDKVRSVHVRNWWRVVVFEVTDTAHPLVLQDNVAVACVSFLPARI